VQKRGPEGGKKGPLRKEGSEEQQRWGKNAHLQLGVLCGRGQGGAIDREKKGGAKLKKRREARKSKTRKKQVIATKTALDKAKATECPNPGRFQKGDKGEGPANDRKVRKKGPRKNGGAGSVKKNGIGLGHERSTMGQDTKTEKKKSDKEGDPETSEIS